VAYEQQFTILTVNTNIFKKEQRPLVVLQCQVDHSTVVVVQQKRLGVKLTTLTQLPTTARNVMENQSW